MFSVLHLESTASAYLGYVFFSSFLSYTFSRKNKTENAISSVLEQKENDYNQWNYWNCGTAEKTWHATGGPCTS